MTINYYNKNAQTFFETTVNADMSNIYNIFENKISKKGKILDLGCGSGRDSKYFLTKGYEVIAIDLSIELAKIASKYINQEVIICDMRDINYHNEFDGIWACASFLHLNEDDIYRTLEKCYLALKDNGIIYLSFKYGTNNYTKDDREFTCFTEDKFLSLITNLNFSKCEFFQTYDVRVNRNDEKWLNVILKK